MSNRAEMLNESQVQARHQYGSTTEVSDHLQLFTIYIVALVYSYTSVSLSRYKLIDPSLNLSCTLLFLYVA